MGKHRRIRVRRNWRRWLPDLIEAIFDGFLDR